MSGWKESYEEDILSKPAEVHVETLLSFVQDHEVKLENIEHASAQDISGSKETAPNLISLAVHPTERAYMRELIRTDNEVFQKITVIFSYLSKECQELQQIAHTTFFGPLSIFGLDTHGDEIDVVEVGQLEIQIGHSLVFFQESQNSKHQNRPNTQ